jgi:hypothetical protein
MRTTFMVSRLLPQSQAQRVALACAASVLVSCDEPPWDERAAVNDDAEVPRLFVEPMMYSESALPARLLHDGDDIELWPPPQGGHVLLVGVRAAGLESRVVELQARLRRPGTREIVAEERRTVAMEPVPEQPSLLESDRRTRTQVAHVAACPDYEPVNVVDDVHELEILVTEMNGNSATGFASVNVVPRCLQADASAAEQCRCECSANYHLGKCAFR